MGQGAMHAAGGSSSNGDKQMHVRRLLFCFTVPCSDTLAVRYGMHAGLFIN